MQATAHAKEYAVKNGPLILEMDTYRSPLWSACWSVHAVAAHTLSCA